jgi:hypothetical protein
MKARQLIVLASYGILAAMMAKPIIEIYNGIRRPFVQTQPVEVTNFYEIEDVLEVDDNHGQRVIIKGDQSYLICGEPGSNFSGLEVSVVTPDGRDFFIRDTDGDGSVDYLFASDNRTNPTFKSELSKSVLSYGLSEIHFPYIVGKYQNVADSVLNQAVNQINQLVNIVAICPAGSFEPSLLSK